MQVRVNCIHNDRGVFCKCRKKFRIWPFARLCSEAGTLGKYTCPYVESIPRPKLPPPAPQPMSSDGG